MRGAPSVLCAALLTVSACSAGPSRHVSIPPRGAAPRSVVAAYLDALDAHDIDAARRLLTAQHAEAVEAAQDSWFTNVESITDVQVDAALHGGHRTGYPERVSIPVSFDLHQRHEESMPDGRTDWSYELIKRSPSDRWLIADEGMG